MGLQRRLDDAIRAYHDAQFDEEDRLAASGEGQVELERTRRLVAASLPESARVLDVGGGTGVHSRWLAEQGRAVTLVDPVPSHVARASAAGSFTAVVGDARRLPVADRSVDAVLLLGPLGYGYRPAHDLHPGHAQRVPGPGRDGPGDPSNRCLFSTHGGFPGGHFHTVRELHAEVAAAGFVGTRVPGVEGPDVGALETVELVERLEERLAGDAARTCWPWRAHRELRPPRSNADKSHYVKSTPAYSSPGRVSPAGHSPPLNRDDPYLREVRDRPDPPMSGLRDRLGSGRTTVAR